MTILCRSILSAAVVLATAGIVSAQAPPAGQTPAAGQTAAAAPADTDVYLVMFVKAAPGQAAALAKQLQQPDPKDPMSGHFLLLRHQEGADWDYCLIQHVGSKATVEITPQPAPGGPALMTSHNDTYVSGPSWGEFQRAMGMTGQASGNPVYVVGVHQAVPGHRGDLVRALRQSDPAAKGPSNDLLFTHLDGASWQYLTLSHYASWQDLGADRAKAATGGGWDELRKHSAAHQDTIADRVR